ncbi:hypothetical protein L596_006195 [Steinernema carpocapsae]|uniref:Uncharacterized protein n=1 Tax=Steinernema carpocapsae TaxID=34508 RepID=A0A4U8V1L5_STECR|nr:hypothetical protein L596_006195 [Steinernema carpocapsae]
MRCLLCSEVINGDIRLHVESHLAKIQEGAYQCRNSSCVFVSYCEESMVDHLEVEEHEEYNFPSQEDQEKFFYGRHLISIIVQDTIFANFNGWDKLKAAFSDRIRWSLANLDFVSCLICQKTGQADQLHDHVYEHLEKRDAKKSFYICGDCGVKTVWDNGASSHVRMTGHCMTKVNNDYFDMLMEMIKSDAFFMATKTPSDPSKVFQGILPLPMLEVAPSDSTVSMDTKDSGAVEALEPKTKESENAGNAAMGQKGVEQSYDSSPAHSIEDEEKVIQFQMNQFDFGKSSISHLLLTEKRHDYT